MLNHLNKFKGKLIGDFFTDYKTRILYATDASAYREIPLAVARPKDTSDLIKLIEFANQHNVSLIPRTAGTSLAGQVVGNGIVVDISKYFTEIIELNKEERWVRVQPGVILDELNMYLKPHGLFYLNVPSNGDVHRWPVDCWRFYPDSGDALVTWGKRNWLNPVLLESYTSAQNKGIWNDFVAVFAKDQAFVDKFPTRILDTKQDYWNGKKYGVEGFLKYATISEDQKRVEVIRKVATGEISVN